MSFVPGESNATAAPRVRLLLDCDGILSDFVSAALALVRDRTGREHTPDQVTAFDIWSSIGLGAADAAGCKRAIGEAAGIARGLKVYDGALEGVAAIRQAGAEIFIVTSPWNSNPTWTHDREWWLEKHFGIKHAQVIHTSAKHLVHGDIFVDDRTDTCERWQAEHPNGLAIAWNTPHNQLESFAGMRTNDWSQLAAIVQTWPAHVIATRKPEPLFDAVMPDLRFDDGGES